MVRLEPTAVTGAPSGCQAVSRNRSLYSTWYCCPFSAPKERVTCEPFLLRTTSGGATTYTVTPRVLLITGVPLSVALRVTVLVEGLWVIWGVQLNTPLLESIVAPAGGATRPQVMLFPSASSAVAVKVTVCPAVT